MSDEAMQVNEATPRYLRQARAEPVPLGCKESDVGLIAQDWDMVPLRRISDFITKGSTPTTYGFKWENRGIVFLRSECVSSHGLDLAQSMFISPAAHAMLRRSEVRDGDLLITITGNVGRVVLLQGVGVANINQHIARVRISARDAEAAYVHQFLSQAAVRQRFESITTGQAYPQISLRQVRVASVPLPSLTEQRAIAEALSDVDRLLEALEALIAKKRSIKQAAMQQLLTGKTRLPGFTGKWETRPFSAVLDRLNAKGCQIQASEYRAVGQYPVIDQGQDLVVGFSDQATKRFKCPDGGVIVFGDHTCITKFISFDFVIGADGTQLIKAKPGQCTRFYAYQLQHNGIEPTGYNRHFKFLKQREFLAPPTDEQVAIAAALSDMDAGIAALENRCDKIRAIKQGMMQQLLTGRVRLVKPSPAEATV